MKCLPLTPACQIDGQSLGAAAFLEATASHRRLRSAERAARRFFLMAGQVDDLAWSLSLLARSWNSDVDLRTASRHSCLNAPPRAAARQRLSRGGSVL